MGEPRTAALSTSAGSPTHQAWNCLTLTSCSSWVSANLVSPVTGSTVTKKCQLPSAGLAAASIEAAPGLPIGPGGRPCTL